MEDFSKELSTSQKAAIGISQVLQRRLTDAQQQLASRLKSAYEKRSQPAAQQLMQTPPTALLQSLQSYWTDAAQRSVLFWDTLRQRGDNYVEHVRAGKPPVLHFDYEIILDARTFEQPVNYALARITPPPGVKVNDKQRPYLIIDPRAGQVPGIGGFKDDSQVGVALRAGHPVYFALFFATPEPGQRMTDVTDVEVQFLRKVRELHPDSSKPVIIGNCQGGWAVMMLAAADPDNVGALLLNGAPLSYWGGSWTEGKGNNPMRYSGGLMGGSWMSSLTADMGNGHFDGAYLVQNFENLNPANTLWTKYRTLYSKVDTEPPRFLDFERWWGAHSLMNREEIEWIVQNLFVGNDLWNGGARSNDGRSFDLRGVRAPIVLFASLGDNITPPQQAFNWVADTYKSTEEIKARGQVIIGLLHESIGHLGVFVSGKVAQKEYTELVSVLKCIETLSPGLYGMQIHEHTDENGKPDYRVSFVEYRLEDVAKRLNRFERVDEKPFQAVEAISDFNQRAYELFAQPFVQAMSNEYMAEMTRELHPLRMDKWLLSSTLNPLMQWLKPAADQVRATRKPVGQEQPLGQVEEAGSEVIEAMLDYYRDVRDAYCEATFFTMYATPYALQLAEKFAPHQNGVSKPVKSPLDLPFVQDALASMNKGGFPAALARAITLLEREGGMLSLHYLELKQGLADKYRDLLPNLSADEWRRIRGEQEIVCRYGGEKALRTLPSLLKDPADRERFLTVCERMAEDPLLTTHEGGLSDEQNKLFKRIYAAVEKLPAASNAVPKKTATKKTTAAT